MEREAVLWCLVMEIPRFIITWSTVSVPVSILNTEPICSKMLFILK